MKNWERVLIEPGTALREALIKIDGAATQMALVVDAQRRLLGTLSDGDIRRGLIKGMSLADPVERAMYKTPSSAPAGQAREETLSMMRRKGLHQVPILDAQGVVVGLEIVDDFFVPQAHDNWIVVMAGGLGTRLKELTEDTPKPMLKVGNRPLLETILRTYIDQGFRQFYLAVNYRAEMIEDHFGNGGSLGVQIRYLREKQRMGTAGALSLLPERPALPIVVTNADLLTKENYGQMLERHIESTAAATMAVRDYEMQVPFGVVRERDGRIETIEEKPIQRFVVSAGMYVLSPQVISLVPRDQFFDMPSLFEAMVREGLSTRCHYIDGYWLDIGRLPDYERANLEFSEVFR